MSADRMDNRDYEMPQADGGTASGTPAESDMPGARKKKKKKGRAGVIILSLLLILSLLMIPVGSFLGYQIGLAKGATAIQASARESGVDNDRVMKKLETMEGLVNDMFLFDVDKDKLEEGIYNGFVSGLGDKYAAYYSPENFKKMLGSFVLP